MSVTHTKLLTPLEQTGASPTSPTRDSGTGGRSGRSASGRADGVATGAGEFQLKFYSVICNKEGVVDFIWAGANYHDLVRIGVTSSRNTASGSISI